MLLPTTGGGNVMFRVVCSQRRLNVLGALGPPGRWAPWEGVGP